MDIKEPSSEDAQPGKSLRVREYVEELIASGLEPHEKLPTERHLADALEVSRMTIRHALDALEAERLVYRVQGSGTYVADRQIDKSIRLTSFSQDMIDRGLRPSSQLLKFSEVSAGSNIGAKLHLSPAIPVYRFERLRLADGDPMCLETVHLRADFFPGLSADALSDSLYQTLAKQFRVTVQSAQQRISATVLDPEQADLLRVPAFTAALVVERTASDDRGRLIENTLSIYRADRYAFTLDISR